MTAKQFDIIVIGSGPGGEGAAGQLASAGLSVAIIEEHPEVGGGCLHWGTIPSKTLRHEIQLLYDYRRHPLFQKSARSLKINYPALLAAAVQVAAAQVTIKYQDYAEKNIEVIHGRARFTGSHEIEVVQSDHVEICRAEKFIVATGSRPYQPKEIDFTHPRILDSDKVLQMGFSPDSIIIYGAGVIGCEYASIFANLGVDVTLINTRDRLLGFLDDEIADALSYTLRKRGCQIKHNETFQQLEVGDDKVTMTCESGQISRADVLLWANGRTGNTDDMGLEEIGITINHRGQIEVDKNFQTSVKHIYAVGDVIGAPGLASASFDQGRFIASCIADGGESLQLIKDIPTGIYTTPEVSSVGRTEKQLTEQKIPYEVGRAHFESIARAQITGHPTGVLKLLFNRETLEILGIHCFGEQASEIVHIGQAIMSQPAPHNSLRYFAETTFNYPTMAEAYRIAALDGFNRIK
ncbi:MAG: Si-specific NAD(P)(+) transhydrogenase [Gammaproteobacteria bacterium]|nr:Si-specific NAD(P)(+) transhydrogenase [Gammaproteobacteria bacterium]